MIDTGAQVSMGNSALLERLRRHRKNVQSITLTSVTGGQMTVDYGLVEGVRLGEVEFSAMPIAFSDVPPFKRFGLMDKPALLLGMDALRSFRRVDIDFPNRQVRFRMPKGSERRPRFTTGSLIPGGGGSLGVKSY